MKRYTVTRAVSDPPKSSAGTLSLDGLLLHGLWLADQVAMHGLVEVGIFSSHCD